MAKNETAELEPISEKEISVINSLRARNQILRTALVKIIQEKPQDPGLVASKALEDEMRYSK